MDFSWASLPRFFMWPKPLASEAIARLLGPLVCEKHTYHSSRDHYAGASVGSHPSSTGLSPRGLGPQVCCKRTFHCERGHYAVAFMGSDPLASGPSPVGCIRPACCKLPRDHNVSRLCIFPSDHRGTPARVKKLGFRNSEYNRRLTNERRSGRANRRLSPNRRPK